MTGPARTLSYGATAAAVLFAVAIIIRPQGLAADNGLSYYGDFKTTVIPYSLAFLAGVYAYWEAAGGVQDRAGPGRRLAVSLRIMAALMAGLLVTPSSLVNPIHTVVGSALFSFQLLVSMWLFFRYFRDRLTGALVSVMWLGGLGSLYYLPGSHGFLLQTQVIFQAAFWLLLIRSVNKLRPADP